MKRRKLYTIASSVICASILLSSCGNGAQKADSGAPYQIQWYFIGNTDVAEIGAVETEVNNYIKDKINATVKMNSLEWGTYNHVSNMISGNESFDLMWTSSYCIPYATNAAKGAFTELDGLLDKEGQGAKKVLGETFLSGTKINGHIYALPINKEQAHNYGIVFRKDLVDKYKIDINSINSVKDLEPALAVIKQNEPEIIPILMGGGKTPASALDFDAITSTGGFYSDTNDSKIVNYFESDKYKEACKLAQTFFSKGYVNEDAGYGSSGATPQDSNYFCWIEKTKPGKADEYTSSSTMGYKFVQKDITAPIISSGDTQGSMMAIPASCKNPAKVMQFLNLLYTDKKLLNTVVFGIEGKNYKKTGDNTIEQIKNSGYSQAGMQWMFGNVLLDYTLPEEDPDKAKKFEEYNKVAKTSKSLGFSFDPSKVKTKISAIENVIKEYQLLLETGSVNVDENLPKFTDKLKQAGNDEVIAEIQKQYDDFKKSGK